MARRKLLLALIAVLLLLTTCIFKKLSQLKCLCPEEEPQDLPVRYPQPVPTTTLLNSKDRTRSSNPEMGYFFALKYYEQQTQAAKNFFQMQCLADSYNMRVVEPFLVKSQLAVPLSLLAQQGETLLPFGDLIDMELWNSETREKFAYRPVSAWREFLAKAPRDVVLLCMKYRNPPHVSIPVPGHDFRENCSEGCFASMESGFSFLKTRGFRLVGKVCVNFADYAGSVRDEDFKEHLFGNRVEKKEPVTVIANEFRGFFGLYRMQLLSPCGVVSYKTANMSVMPSLKLVADARSYAASNYNGRPYVSVLVRVERIILHKFLNLATCAEEVVRILKTLEAERDLKEIFLAMDVGKFGSSGSIRHNLLPQGEKFFKLVYGDRLTFNQWEDSFSRATSANNSAAYVANLQRTVAAKGDCLLMVGAGGFQAQARSLYEVYHPDPASWCVYKVCG